MRDSLEDVPSTCAHSEAWWDNDELWCPDCNEVIGVICPLCHGEGFGEECEIESDWINYGNDLITCPECGGKGWTSDPSFQ